MVVWCVGLTLYVKADSPRFNTALPYLMIMLIEIGLREDRHAALDKLLIMVVARAPCPGKSRARAGGRDFAYLARD